MPIEKVTAFRKDIQDSTASMERLIPVLEEYSTAGEIQKVREGKERFLELAKAYSVGLLMGSEIESKEDLERKSQEIPIEFLQYLKKASGVEEEDFDVFFAGVEDASDYKLSSGIDQIVRVEGDHVWEGISSMVAFSFFDALNSTGQEVGIAQEDVWDKYVSSRTVGKSSEEVLKGEEDIVLEKGLFNGSYFIGQYEALSDGFLRLSYRPASPLKVLVRGSFEQDFITHVKNLGKFFATATTGGARWLNKAFYLLGLVEGSDKVLKAVEEGMGREAIYRPLVYRGKNDYFESGVVLPDYSPEELGFSSETIFQSLDRLGKILENETGRDSYDKGVVAGFEEAFSIVRYRLARGCSPVKLYLDLLGLSPVTSQIFERDELQPHWEDYEVGVGEGWKLVIDRVRNVVVAMEVGG